MKSFNVAVKHRPKIATTTKITAEKTHRAFAAMKTTTTAAIVPNTRTHVYHILCRCVYNIDACKRAIHFLMECKQLFDINFQIRFHFDCKIMIFFSFDAFSFAVISLCIRVFVCAFSVTFLSLYFFLILSL